MTPFGDSLKFFAELEKRIIEGQRPDMPSDLPPVRAQLGDVLILQ